MKYTKKVPYFKKGDKVKKRVEVGNTGKTKEEIMAEARRNQAIEKKAQVADAEKAKTANNVSKPKKDLSGTSYKAKPYSGNISKPKKDLSGTSSKAKTASIVALPTKAIVTPSKPSTTQSTVDKSGSASESVEINRLNDLNTVSASKDVQVTTPVEIGSSEYKNYPRYDVSRFPPPLKLTIDGNTTTYREDNPYTAPKYYRREFVTDRTGAQVPIYFSGTDPENLKRIKNYALVNRGPHYRAQQIFDKIDREIYQEGNPINTGSAEVEQFTLPWLTRPAIDGNLITRPVTDRDGNIVQGPDAESITNSQQYAIDFSRLPEMGMGEEVEPVKVEWPYINEAGKKEPLVANRLRWPMGGDNTFLATDDGKHIFERDILHQGDTIYTDSMGRPPAASELPMYKKIFDEADKKIWEAKRYQQGEQTKLDQAPTPPATESNTPYPIIKPRKNSFMGNITARSTTPIVNITGADGRIWQGNRYRNLGPAEFAELKSGQDTLSRRILNNKHYFTLNGKEIRKPDSYITDLFNNLDYEDSKAMTQEKEKKAIGGYTARFQQGGQMPQEGSQEELVLDFAVRYLITMGVPEEDIMDPQGNLNPEYQQELEQVFNSQEISWSDYAASPDEYMQQFIGNLQAQTQMARKGAKLKRLSKLRIYKK